MQPSKRQQKVYDTWNNEDCNIVISAVAGSGKTSVLMQLLKYCDSKTLFLAFNKSIQTEIQEKIERENIVHGQALTLHSLGLQAIRSTKKSFKVDSNKNFKLFDEFSKEHKNLIRLLRLNSEKRLEFLYFIMEMNDVSRMFLIDNVKEILQTMKTMDKNIMLVEEELLEKLWSKFVEIRKQSYEKPIVDIDFLDMIYVPVSRNLYIPTSPTYLFIDEAQDLNYVQHQFIENLLKQGNVKKWVCVGDKNQSIYGFCGAHSNSFDMFLKKDNVKLLPLDICYRCSPSIINEANAVYNIMKPFKESPGIVGIETDVSLIKPNSMVICRNTRPLIDLYFELVINHKPVCLKGDDILSGVIKFLKPYIKNHTTISVISDLNASYRSLEEKFKKPEDQYKLYKFKENFESFKKLKKGLFGDNVVRMETFIKKLDDLYKVEKDCITLCTIHKSKGLEADIVYILNEDLIPSKFASSDEQLIQEENLRYVARTRAKNELYYLNLNTEG